MKIKKHFKILILGFILVLAACSQAKKNNNETLANPYIEHDNYFIKDLSLLNLNDSVSELAVGINTNKLLYKISAAQYSIKYVVYESYSKKIIVDSATTTYSVNKDQSENTEIQKIKFTAYKGKNYFVEVIAKDLHRSSQFSVILDLNKKDDAARNYFSATQNNKAINNNCHIDTNQVVMVQNKTLADKNIYIKCYFRTFKLPFTPFDLSSPDHFEHRADTMLHFKTDSTGTFSFTPMKKGFYFIQSDTSSVQGFVLFHFSREFPYIVHTKQLLEPLTYITSSSEYEKISKSVNVKQAIDDFWEQNCGSKDRARESIKLYYSRIELANQFFSSYREGWRTDRGMIFIIFGPPQLVYRTDDAEKWFYGADNTMMTDDFTFYKVGNPYSNNAFNLERLTTYKNLWYKMIEAWRDGRIY